MSGRFKEKMQQKKTIYNYDPRSRLYDCIQCNFSTRYYTAIMKHARKHLKNPEPVTLKKYIDAQTTGGVL